MFFLFRQSYWDNELWLQDRVTPRSDAIYASVF